MRVVAAKRGFTLIEVLVVVSIIAMLIAILLPSLQRAREQTRSIVCAARIRQLGIGMNFYLQQHFVYPAHQWIIFNESGVEVKRIRWFQEMAKYLSGFDVQSCGSVKDWGVGRNNSYGYNYKYIGSGRDNLMSPTRPFERFPVKAVKSPARTIAFGDSDGTGWELPHDDNDKNARRFGNHGYTLDPTHIPEWSEHTTNGPELEQYAWKDVRTYISTRHMGRSNLCFTDGHVERLGPEQVYIDNRYWNGLGGRDPVNDKCLSEKLRATNAAGLGWRFPDIPS